MNIYDALEKNRVTPTLMKDNNEEEISSQKGEVSLDPIASNTIKPTTTPSVSNTINTQLDEGYYSPSDQNKIKAAYSKYENNVINSEQYKEVGVNQISKAVEFLKTEIDSYNLPEFNVSPEQFRVMSLLMANAEDKDAMREKIEPALLYANTLKLPLLQTVENLESISKEYGIGRYVNKGNLYQKITGAVKVGLKTAELADVGNELALINEQLEGIRIKEETGEDKTIVDKVFSTAGQILNGEIGEAISTKGKSIEELEARKIELEKQAENINNTILQNTNNIDDGMLSNLLQATAQSAPYMFEVMKSGAEMAILTGAAIATLTATGFTGGTSLSATAGLASQGVGALMKTKSLVAAAVSVGAFQGVKKVSKGPKYLEYINNGVSHRNAKISSDIFGSIAAFEETMFDALPIQMLGSLLGKTTGSVFIKNAIQRFGMSGKPARALTAFVGAGESGFGEGFTEFSQYFTEAFSDAFTYAKAETGSMLNIELSDVINSDTIKEASEQFAMGFGISLLLGAASTFGQVKMNINEYNAIENIMKTSDSKVFAINEASKISPETSKKVLSDLWDKYQASHKNKTANINNNSSNEEVDTKTKTTNDVTYKDVTTRLKGNSSLLKTTTLRDADGKELGTLKKTEIGNTISINDVNIAKPEQAYNAIKNIISNNVGKNILLNTNGDVILEEINQRLTEENPRGKEFGLSWYVSTNDEIELSKKIQTPFNMTEEQARVSSKLIANLAKHENLTATQYWDKHFPNGIDTKTLDADKSLKDKKGAIKFLNNDRLQAVIYTSKNSNVSTFTHETFHLAVHQMENKGVLAKAIKNWVKTDEFKTFFEENRKFFGTINYDNVVKEADSFDVSDNASWTFNQDELSASLFEAWQASDKQIEDQKMASLFTKIAEWFKDIYSAVKSNVKINEDISNYFEQMYGDTINTEALNDLENKINEQSKLEKYNEAKFLQQQKISEIENKIKTAKGKKKHNLLLELRNAKKDLDGIRYQSEENNDTENLSEGELIRETYENTDEWLKAPNGADTNLSEDLWVKVRTTAFKDWFGDWENDPENASKVVDKNGEPLVVYHGGAKDISVFEVDRDNSRNGQSYGQGTYFATEKHVAEGYGKKGEVYSVFLNLKNPLLTKLDKDNTSKDYLKKADISKILAKTAKLQEIALKEEDQSYSWKDSFLSDYVDTYSFEDGLSGLEKASKEATKYLNNITNADISFLLKYADQQEGVADIIEEVTGVDGYYAEFEDGTRYYIAPKANQIKSVENNGAFSNEDDNILFQTMSKEEEPKKTGKGFKLFESRDGKLYPLFIGSKKETEMGVWFKAENLPTKGFAKRPGWHIGATTPDAPWLKSDNGTDVGYYKSKWKKGKRVWAEVEYPMDIDYQPEADKSPTKDLPNKIPKGGSYLFKEGQRGTWVVTGGVRVNRILSDQEVDDILKAQGYDQAKAFEKYRNAIIKRKETLAAKKAAKSNEMLFQTTSEAELSEAAIEEAMRIEDFDTFEVIYKATHPDFVDKTGTWLKDKFEQAKQRAGLENVEHIYKSTSTNEGKNIIFKKSLENKELSNQFIRKMTAFKKHIENVKGKILTSATYQINARLLEDINTLFDGTEVITSGKINSLNRDALMSVVEKNPSQARIIFAKLHGLDYMMGEYEYDNSDYFEVFVNNYDGTDKVLSGAILSSTNEEVRQKMRADYKVFLENKNAQAKNLKTLLENVRKQRDASVKKNKGMAAEIERLNQKYNEDVSRYLANYKKRIDDLEEGIKVEKLSREISDYKINTNVRGDSARDLYAFKALLNVKDRNNFNTPKGDKWSGEYVNNLIRKNLGEYYATIFTPKMLEKNMKEKGGQQGFVSEELEVLKAVMDNIKRDGIQKRNVDIQAMNNKVSNNLTQLEIAVKASLAKFKEGKLYKAIDKLPNSDKITPIVSGIFSGTFNIVRKAMLLDGLDVGQKGPWYNLLVNRRRELADKEAKSVDKRKSKLNDILVKHNLNTIELAKTVFETTENGFKQKHSAVDLGYYYLSQFNDDNKIAVAGGHLMTAEERADPSMTHEEFETEALRRYDIVLEEAKKLYKENEGYHELFDTIMKEFNGEVMRKMNELMMKIRNKQSQAIRNYLAIQRKGETTTEVLAQFEIDVDENGRYDNIDSTAFGALKDRNKIDIRKQTDINTDLFDLISKTIDKQEHLLANYEYVYELKQTFTGINSSELRELITNGYGQSVYNDIVTFIEEVANPYANKHDTALDKLVKPLKGNIYPAFLGARTPVVIMQMITSPAAFMGKMNVFQYIGSFLHTITNRGEVINKVNNLSPFMKNRSWDYAWSDSWTSRHVGGKLSYNELRKEYFMEKMMGGLKWADQTTVYSGWNELYEQELNRLGLSTDENIEKAVKYADDFVRNTQPLSDITEISPLFKSGEASKLFTQFTASLSPIYQNVFFDTVALQKQGKGSEAVGMMLGYMMVGALLFASRGGYEKDDNAEDIFRKFIASSVSQPISSLPLVGSVVEYLVKYAITGDSSGLYSTSKFPMFDKLTSGTTKFIAGDYLKGLSVVLDGIMIGSGLPYGLKVDLEKSIEEMRNDKLPLSFIGYDR